MDVTLQINGATEAELRRRATLTGKDVAELVLETLEDRLDADEPEMADRQVRLQAFRDLIASMPSGNVDADLSRESAYDDRGL